MYGEDTKNPTPSGDRAYFIPIDPSQVVIASAVKSLYIRYKQNLGPEHFKDGRLLLLQHETGGYQWTFSEGLFRQDHNVRLYACGLSHKEADFIAKDRVLFIQDDDSRLSNFGLLSRVEKPPSWDEAVESFDLVNRHLASKRVVIIYHVDEMGNKITDEIKTADYSRAKRDISIQPENTRNMRRFCNREGSNGEGPSDLQSRICFGYVKPIYYPSKSTSFNSFRQLTLSSSNKSDTLSVETSPDMDESHFPPIRRYRKHSTAYYLMKLAFYPRARLEAEQHRHDLTHARKEKKPERVTAVSEHPRPSQWTAKALKKAFNFCARSKRHSSSCNEIHGSNIRDIDTRLQAEEDEEDEDVGENKIRRCNKMSEIHLEILSFEALARSSSVPSFIPDEGISPLTLTPAAVNPALIPDFLGSDCDSNNSSVDITFGSDSISVEMVLTPGLGSSMVLSVKNKR